MAKARVPVSRKTFKTKAYNTNHLTQKTRRLDKERAKTDRRRKRRFKYFVADIPKIISGKKARVKDYERKVYNAFWSSVMQSMFISIYLAYERKSRGLSDELGNSWSDLSPYTKAYKKDRRGRLTRPQRAKLNKDTPGLLTPAQYKRWKKDFATHFNKSMNGKKSASGQFLRNAEIAAAKYAWYNAKRRGAETLLNVLGEQKYPIMKETGALQESFKPGKISPNLGGAHIAYRKGNINQIAKTYFGSAFIGTRVPYATMAEGKGENRRPLWPRHMDTWFNIAMDAGWSAVRRAMPEIVGGWK